MSVINQDLIFNFNLNDCFDLSQHLRYFQPLNAITNVFMDPNRGIIGFNYNNSKTPGGILMKMATIPGQIYHLFAVGQVVMGSFITIKVQNPCPEINLAQPKEWQMGCHEVPSSCFRALSHQTNIIITTDRHCFCNLAPYNFLLLCLSIIPDNFMCQGFIAGTTGATGATGPIGKIGRAGPVGSIIAGRVGPPGAQGPTGPPGFSGPSGITGQIGAFGRPGNIGPQGTVFGPQGETGAEGLNGGIGSMGAQGVQGSVGPVGTQGIPAYILNATGSPGNVVIGSANLNWFRGGDDEVALNVPVVYQVTDNSTVMLRISQFVSVGSFDGVNPIYSCMSSTSLPAEVRTSANRQNFFPCIIEVGNSSTQTAQDAIIEIGPAILTVYSDLQFNCDFDPTKVVVFPTQTFTYYKS